MKNQPEMFFYYNNGIKLLCKKITKKLPYSVNNDVGLFVLEGVSLVNGAQTTGVIGSVCTEDPESVASAKIFVEMIDLGDTDDEQAKQITKLTNTQNKIEGKDFVSLDPQQDRLRMELSLAGIQYLFKGTAIDDPEHQISLDEAIIAQACSIPDLSVVALVKRNVGALTENIEKTPYKLLFNGATNSFSLHNGVQVLRAVDYCIKRNEPGVTGRKRLVLVHGNRFLLHLIIERIKTCNEYNTQYLDSESIRSTVSDLFVEYWDKVFDAMEEKYPESYPAHIFKNVGRLREVAAAMQQPLEQE